MPKDYFKISETTALKDISKGARIHLTGICGVAMGQLAAALKDAGYEISGSDKAFYEPMGSFLNSQGLKTFEGYRTENITQDISLAVIGNAISYGNPEVLEIEKQKIPYTCFPKILSELIIQDRKSIVVSGTHGKTTTSSLIAQALINMKEQPSYFIGGVVESLPRSLMGGKNISVVEGDEYDSAFFAKVPKFNFYQPDIFVINAIEFDHADIYQNLEEINKVFLKMVKSLKKESILILCLDFKNLASLYKTWQKELSCKVITFGEGETADYKIVNRSYQDNLQVIKVKTKNEIFEISLPLTGLFNARNALAAFLGLKYSGFSKEKIFQALTDITAPKRRQEILFENDRGLKVIEDFAHHPTAVKENLLGLQEKYPREKLLAVFEPASNTSRRKIFEKDFAEALAIADEVIILEPFVQESEAFSAEKVCEKIREKGKIASCFTDSQKITEYIKESWEEDTIVSLMSNGSFQGLKEVLISELKAE